MRTAILICGTAILIAGAVPLRAQGQGATSFDARIRKSIDHIYNLEFAAAEQELRILERERPDHPAGPFFLAMVEWWRILISLDDRSRDERFYGMLERVIRMCDARLKKDPNDVTALFFKGGSIGFRGRLKANRGSWIAAADDGMTALPIVRKAFSLDPKNTDVLLGIGIYNYYADVIPDRYPIVKPLMLFFPSGDRTRGLEQLREASVKGEYARVEATYFLLQNYYLFEKDFTRAVELARSLHTSYPMNPVFHRYLGRCLVSLGQLSGAAEVFAEVERRFRERRPGYDAFDGREAYYYLGRQEFFAGEYERALSMFRTSDSLSKKVDTDGPSGFRAMANLHIGMVLDVLGRRAEAMQHYRIVLAMKEYEHSHRDARQYLRKPYGRGS